MQAAPSMRANGRMIKKTARANILGRTATSMKANGVMKKGKVREK